MNIGELQELVSRALGGDYTVERELTGGGVAKVVVAFDRRLARRVVVKILPPSLLIGDTAERFRREIQFALQLQHPHIVPILSAGDVDGLAYLVMPFVDGNSLRARLAAGPIGVSEAMRTLRGIVLALAYAHARQVVHRDIKPDNVLLSGGSAVVTDFGIAKALDRAKVNDDPPPGTLTLSGTSLGTPTYMAPEQVAGDPDTDHRADIYSFGVLAYEMLAGVPPFTAQTVAQLFAAHLAEAPVPLSNRCHAMPPRLAALIMQCLEKDPAHRPQSAAEMMFLLDDPNLMSGVAKSKMPSSIADGGRVGHITGARAMLITGFVVLLATFAFVLNRTKSTTPRPPSQVAAIRSQMPAVPSVVVFPVVSVGNDSAQALIAAALTEELTTALGARRDLRVASRTGAAALQRRIIDGEGNLTGMTAYVEGAIYHDGGRLRAALRLVDVANGIARWSAVMDVPRDGIDSALAQSSAAIHAALKVSSISGSSRSDSP